MSIGKMKHLEGFYLYNNNLNGEIPQEIGNMTTLLQLDLRNNQLEGEIPATHYSEISTI
jgi:Leucine-rich repeat (LRR) protein